MRSLAVSEGAQLFSFPMDSLAYRQNIERTPQPASQYSVAIATLVGVATAFVVQTYHPKDVLFTPGQLAITMDTEENSVSIKSIWQSTSSAWVTRLLGLCNCGNEEAALKEISLATTDFKSSGKFQQLSDDLMRLNSAKLPDIVLIGLLRNTYSVRAYIPIWDALLDQTEQILTSHNKNSRAMLRGLKGH